MQSRIRKTRCFKRTKWFRKASLTCLSLILISCAHNGSKTEGLSKVKEQLSKLCLSGEGRGRIKVLSNTILFSYESINSIEDKLWKMGLDVPLHGTELLTLYWGDIEKSGAKLKGQFARRIYSTLRNHKDSTENLINLKAFANGLGEIIYLNNSLQTDDSTVCSSEACRVGARNLKWKLSGGSLLLDHMVSKNHFMRFEFSNLTLEGPGRVSIYPINKGKEQSSFRVELFLNSCE